MKTRIAISFVAMLLTLGMTASASGQDLASGQDMAITLSIHPLAVIMQPDNSQYFLAMFSDGSPALSCNWTATGVGRNGVTLTTINKNWAVLYDGSLAGVNYVISATCKSSKGSLSTAHAYVFVR